MGIDNKNINANANGPATKVAANSVAPKKNSSSDSTPAKSDTNYATRISKDINSTSASLTAVQSSVPKSINPYLFPYPTMAMPQIQMPNLNLGASAPRVAQTGGGDGWNSLRGGGANGGDGPKGGGSVAPKDGGDIGAFKAKPREKKEEDLKTKEDPKTKSEPETKSNVPETMNKKAPESEAVPESNKKLSSLNIGFGDEVVS